MFLQRESEFSETKNWLQVLGLTCSFIKPNNHFCDMIEAGKEDICFFWLIEWAIRPYQSIDISKMNTRHTLLSR